MSTADPHLQGAARVREVFERVRRGDAGVAELYAENAVILYGGDGRAEGRTAIREFYARIIASIAPQPSVEAVLEAPPLFVAIVDVPTSTGHHRALDLFHVDEGGIRRLEIFSRQ